MTTNIITILLGLMAGMIALRQVKLTIILNSKTKWIETLRETISEYCMEISNCNHLKINLFDEKRKLKERNEEQYNSFLDKYYIPYSESAKKAEKLQAKLMLYLDSKNDKHRNLEELINQNAGLIKVIDRDNRNELGVNINEMILGAKEILRIENKKLKKLF